MQVDITQTDWFQQARTLSTAEVSDALDSLLLPGSALGIRPVAGPAKLFGLAFTIRYAPIDRFAPGTVGDYIEISCTKRNRVVALRQNNVAKTRGKLAPLQCQKALTVEFNDNEWGNLPVGGPPPAPGTAPPAPGTGDPGTPPPAPTPETYDPSAP